MEDLEAQIQSILQDPAQMEQIMNMARSLGLEPPDTSGVPSESSGEAPQALPQIPVAQLLQAGRLDKRQENLLNAIKPFLKPNRREKIDRAMRAARLSHLAGFALRSQGEKKT